jgi:diketogulonate reductase-like aldo/keto reductase
MSASRRELLVGTVALCAARSAWAQAPKGKTMLQRTIPSSREALPAIGMGTWQTFDVGSAAAERAPLAEVLRRFFALGGRLIDSSPMYGRAESVVGELLRQEKLQGKAFLATKVWTEGAPEGEAEMAASMRKMGTARMDLMQVHNLLDWQTHWKTMKRLREEKKVRYLGITHYQLSAFPQMERILRDEKPDFVQLPYSVGVRDAEKTLLPLAQELGVAVIVMRPFEGGTLFARARKRPLPAFAQELQCQSWAQLFLKFILAHPAVTCVIPATSKPRHLTDNMGAGLGPLPTDAQRKQILEAVNS